MKIAPEVTCALYAFASGPEEESAPAVDARGRSAQGPSIGEDPSGRGPFACEHFQFVDEDEDEDAPQATTGAPLREGAGLMPLRPALARKGGSRRPSRGRRVRFDEAVVLYADGGPRTLALTSGEAAPPPQEVFFEPPDGYRDEPPFEPPAEYRDGAEAEGGGSQEDDSATHEPATHHDDESAPREEPPPQEVAVATPEPIKDTTTTTQESDQLFERFLEAEREFAADDELDSVFHALEDEFSNSKCSNSLDDSFFRKLIHLLSSAETPPQGEETVLQAEAEEDAETPPTGEEAHSRTLSEADSDCSISSQDTIIVRLGEEPPAADDSGLTNEVEEKPDEVEVFAEEEKQVVVQRPQVQQPVANRGGGGEEESLSRQSSGEQSVASSQDHPQDADDSTSSDSRSGEVEEEIRLDDIGYDEEDADDYDEESFRGMARGNSKIRRIIRKNALQCTLLRGVEAKRRAPRPKSPLLSQESLVEKLKWLTTMGDEGKQQDSGVSAQQMQGSFQPPDVILSAGGLNGSIPSSEQDFYRSAGQRYYAVRQDGFHPSLPRQRALQHTLPHRPVPHWPEQHQQQQRTVPNRNTMTVPRNFRDWRVIQRINNVGRGVPADYVRCGANGAYAPAPPPPDVTAMGRPQQGDELEQFARADYTRTERIRKRYSVAEDDDDPTFGFARRPSVRGVQGPQPDSRLEPLCEDQRHSVYGCWAPAPHQRASVAIAPHATLPYAHRRPPQDPRYHSYAESVWGGPQGPWAPLRDERGAPEGASSSPKTSQDSLYHRLPAAPCSPQKEEGVIYYSLNV